MDNEWIRRDLKSGHRAYGTPQNHQRGALDASAAFSKRLIFNASLRIVVDGMVNAPLQAA